MNSFDHHGKWIFYLLIVFNRSLKQDHIDHPKSILRNELFYR